jgi:excisionase family DNA binding protein
MEKMIFEVPGIDAILFKLDKIEKKIETINRQKSLEGLLLTSKEACIVLKVSARSLQTYRDRGIIPFIQFGHEVRFRPDDLQQFLMDHFIKARFTKGGAV